MSGPERRMADEPSLAIKHNDLNLDGLAGNDCRSRLMRSPRHRIAESNVFGFGMIERFRRSVRGTNFRTQVGRAAGGLGELRQGFEIDGAALGMKIEQPLSELGHFADTASNGDARHRMGLHIFQRAADKIAHVDQRALGQVIHLLHGSLRRRSGRGSDVGKTHGAGDINTATDRVNPSGAGIGHNDASGAEDRQAANNAEPAVHGLGRKSLAAGDRDLHFDIPRIAMGSSDFRYCFADQLPGHGIDGGFAGRHRQAWLRHRADALTGAKTDAGTRSAGPNRHLDQRAVSHIRIVARILDHTGDSRTVVARRGGEREGRALTAWQGHRHGIGKFTREQACVSRLGGRCGAGAGGPTPSERLRFFVHASRYKAPEARRHGESVSPGRRS